MLDAFQILDNEFLNMRKSLVFSNIWNSFSYVRKSFSSIRKSFSSIQNSFFFSFLNSFSYIWNSFSNIRISFWISNIWKCIPNKRKLISNIRKYRYLPTLACIAILCSSDEKRKVILFYPLSRMLHDILDDDHIQWHPPLIGHYTNFWPLLIWTLLPNLTFYLIVQGFHRTYATGAACQQRTLTPPDTWSCPTLGLACVLMSRPISPELVLSPDFWISNTPRYFSFAYQSKRNFNNVR